MVELRLFRQAIAAALLASAASANAAVVYTFDATQVGLFGAGPYGTVTLVDTGSNIDVTVDLRGDMNFVNTGGGHSVFSFNLAGAAIADITSVKFNGVAPPAGKFTVVAPGTNPPFSNGSNFTFMIDCTGGTCQNGAPGQSFDPLTFTVLNAEYSDFGAETLSPPGISASFAADVICDGTRIPGGIPAGQSCTGAIGVTGGGTTKIPEPGTALLAGLALLGLAASRHKRQEN